MADRFAVPFQAFITNGAVITSDVTGRVATAGNTTLTLSTTGGAGTFTITLGSGCTGTITSGTATITDSPKALVAGANTVTSNGAGNCTLNLTLGTAANTNTVNTWSASDGGVSGASVPTSADNTYCNANSFTAASQVLTVDAAMSTLDFIWTGATNTPTLAFGAINGGATGNVTFIAAMAITSTTGRFYSSGNVTLTTNGVSVGVALAVDNAAGVLTLADNLTITKGIYFDRGTIDTNGKTVNGESFSLLGTNAKTLTLGASVLNLTDYSYSGSNLTVTANTSTINVTGTGAFAGGNITTYNNINLNGTAHTVSGAFTCVTLTRNGTATKTDTLTMTAGTTVTATTFAPKGNSVTNRLLVQSSTLGTAATITATNWTGTINVDLMDITATNAIDLSAITGGSGDCGGNTNITFTTAAAQISATTDTWGTAAKWADGVGTDRVPLPQDDVTCSHNVTVDMPRIGKSITFTGTPTVSLSNEINNYGSFVLPVGCTYTHNGRNNNIRGRGSFTLTTGGKTFYGINVYAPSGTYALQDSDGVVSNGLALYNGTIDFNDQSWSPAYLWITGTTTRGLSLGNGTTTLTGLSAYFVGAATTTGLTFNAENSTIVLTRSDATGHTFAGGGLTYNNITVQGTGAYALTITGSNRFNTFKVDRSEAAKTITITPGTTQTIAHLIVPRSGTTVATLNTGGAAATITGNTEYVDGEYLNLTSIVAGYTNKYYAANSTDGTGNTNWIFKARPRGGWTPRHRTW